MSRSQKKNGGCPIPVLPADLRLGLRDEAKADLAFLQELYRSTREEEARKAGFDPRLMRSFLDSQFALQHQHYHSHYRDGGAFWVVEQNGHRIGRLYLHQGPEDLRLVDISLLPSWRGRGYGQALVLAVQALAARRPCPVSLHVYPDNPALRLYQRLDFGVADRSAAHWRLEWHPAAMEAEAPSRAIR